MRSMVKPNRRLALLRGPAAGLAAFAALSFTAAELAERGILPMEIAAPSMLFLLLLSAVIGGALSGGAGKRGLLTGGILAMLYLLGKAVFRSDVFFTSETLLGLLCIIPGSWLGSCIFHKKRRDYTKRNRKNRRRNYK